MQKKTSERVVHLRRRDGERRVRRIQRSREQWEEPDTDAERSVEIVDVRDARRGVRTENRDGAKIDLRRVKTIHVARDLFFSLVIPEREAHSADDVAGNAELHVLALEHRDLF